MLLLRTIYLTTRLAYFVFGQEDLRAETQDALCNNVNPGSALFLTPYIEAGQIEEGRNLARVPFTDAFNITSYSGYFTVNKTYNSNHFFWYFPPLNKNESASVLLWLQGGPGTSSLLGLFVENGPFKCENGMLSVREYHWALNYHLIYIDNPVGAGFSFTEDLRGYCTEQITVGEQLYSSATQFFQLFPNLQNNKFIVSGESYGGKYVPALSYTIHKKNPTAETKINLKALAIGNGLSDPVNQLLYSKYLPQIGLIDRKQALQVEALEQDLVKVINAENWKEAATFINQFELTIFNMTGFRNPFNYLYDQEYLSKEFVKFLELNETRDDLHVGNQQYRYTSEKAYDNLLQDIMKSVAPWIEELLNHYKVLIYNGQLDIIVAYPLTVNYLEKLKFNGSDDLKNANRVIWYVDDKLAGYQRFAGNLVETMVRNAGHMVPSDQPLWAWSLINDLDIISN